MNTFVQKLKTHKKLYSNIMIYYSFIHGILEKNHVVLSSFLIIQYLIFNPKMKVNFYRTASIKENFIQNNIKLKILEKNKMREVYAPQYFKRVENERILQIESPEIYSAVVEDVSIIGGNSFFLKDSACLYDFFDMDSDNRYDLRYGSLVSMSKKKNAAIASIDSNEIIDEGIFLVGFGSHNYYHLTIELMTKFHYINQIENLKDISILVDEVVQEIPQFNELLKALNITSRNIIPIKKDHKYSVKTLHYISDCAWMPINVKGENGLVDEDCRLSAESIKYLSQTVKAYYEINSNNQLKDKIFLSRRKSYLQRLTNEFEVSEIFKDYGFRIVYPEDLTLNEQVKVFANANVVAGTTGAALTNIIYCENNTKFICIIPQKYNFNIYSTIAYNLELDTMFLDSEIVKKGKKISGDRFKLDLNYTRDFLNEINI